MARTKLVLHVEDQADHAYLVQRCFTKLNSQCELLQVDDGQKALDYLRNPDVPRPDLVLLDLQLPKVSGLDVLREIKSDEQLKSIPVVILTTSSDDVDMQGATSHHVNSYLVKPPELAKLRVLLKRVDEYWLQQDRLRPPTRAPEESP